MYYSLCTIPYFYFFFFNDTATTEIYTLSLHDALPISAGVRPDGLGTVWTRHRGCAAVSATSSAAISSVRSVDGPRAITTSRSGEHTSELQSLAYLVFRLLL